MKNKALVLLAGLAMLAGRVCAGGQANAAAHPAQAPQLVVLDTDIGDDIDDAFALALALKSPEVRILGVTTAFGDTELRARLVDRYLKAVGREDIPVLAGVRTEAPGPMSQSAYARQEPERKHGDGVAFLLEQIRAHPHQVTLIAIGPLFNVQAAIERDPETFRLLKRVVMMGGSVYRGYDHGGSQMQPPSAEWNIRCDPAGAKELLASGVPVYMMPLDSTQIHLEQPEQAAIFSHGSPLTDQLTLLYHDWSGKGAWRTPTLFDPVAVTYALWPELCPAKPMHLDVDEKGFTRPGEGMPNAQVCLQSNEAGFLELLLERITGAPER